MVTYSKTELENFAHWTILVHQLPLTPADVVIIAQQLRFEFCPATGTRMVAVEGPVDWTQGQIEQELELKLRA